MLPKYHILLGLIFALLIWYFFPIIGIAGFFIIFLSSFLIDFDHYLGYVFVKKDLNPINSYKWHMNNFKRMNNLKRSERNKFYSHLCIFHGIEVLVILIILSIFVSYFFIFIFIGFLFHLFLDLIYEPFYFDRIDKMCLFYDYFKFKKLERMK